ncbi:hypothetical protein DMI70_00820 [Escherichia coli]|nr:hypothetical protein [Escherichia coli]
METTALTNLNYQQTHFVMSAPDIRHLPSDTGIEVAFAGRSNAGKSSALNTLTNQKSPARTSKPCGAPSLSTCLKWLTASVWLTCWVRLCGSPGRDEAQMAARARRVPRKRQSLQGLVVLMDIRHPLKDLISR